MNLGIVFLWIVVFLIIFSRGSSPQPALSSQAEHAWWLVENGIMILVTAVGLWFAVLVLRNTIRND